MDVEIQGCLEFMTFNSSVDELRTNLESLARVFLRSRSELGTEAIRRICDDFMRKEVRWKSINAMLVSIVSRHPTELGDLCSECLSHLSPDTVACGVRSRQLHAVTISHEFICELEYGEYSDDWTACRVWPGGIGLSRLLLTGEFSVRDCVVLELGSGLGLGGLAALRAGASNVGFTEYKQSRLDVALKNVLRNSSSQEQDKVDGFVLDWTSFDPHTECAFRSWRTKLEVGEFVVIGSEVIYEDFHPPIVFDLMCRLFNAGASKALLVVMRKPFRAGLSEFLTLLRSEQAPFTWQVSDFPMENDQIAACVWLTKLDHPS